MCPCRFVEEGVRSTAVASLATTAKVYKAKAGSDEKKYAHIDAADLKKVQLRLALWHSVLLSTLHHTPYQSA